MGYKQFMQGEFKPVHPERYTGTFPIVYRSSYELHLMFHLDSNPNCVNWKSESLVVNYTSPLDGMKHRYFVDFCATFKTPTGLRKLYIEVKPKAQTIRPVESKRKKQKTLLKEMETWIVNQAKWESATKIAKQHGADFVIITEDQLFQNK